MAVHRTKIVGDKVPGVRTCPHAPPSCRQVSNTVATTAYLVSLSNICTYFPKTFHNRKFGELKFATASRFQR